MDSQAANITVNFIDKHVDGSDAVAWGEAVQAVTAMPGWETICEFFERKRQDTLKTLAGGLHPHDVYLYNHGILEGLSHLKGVTDGIIEAGTRAKVDLEHMLVQTGPEE